MEIGFENKECMDELKKLEQDKMELTVKTAKYASDFAEEIIVAQPPAELWGGEVVIKKETVKDKTNNIIKRLKTVLGWN